jgi:DNA-binding response OmpR family regulator
MTGSHHVVLVEDDQSVRDSLRHLLESCGHRVDVAGDGLHGIELALAVRPDALLVDLGLPLLDGCEVARQVKNVFGDDVLLVGVTGSTHKDDRIRMMLAGFGLVLTKPVDPETLRQALDPQPYLVRASPSEPQ